MCSISGFVVTDPAADRRRIADFYTQVLARGAERGRDSAGVVGLNDKGDIVRRVVIAPQDYEFAHEAVGPRCTVLIGNNRAEPTTEFVLNKTEDDAQPFGDGPIFVSHNGVIANDQELRQRYGITPPTRVDSAVCPGVIRRLGVHQGLLELQGSFAMAIVNADMPHKLWLARNYKPLFLQRRPDLGALFFASRPGYLLLDQYLGSQLLNPAVVQLSAYHWAEVDGSTGQVCEEALEPRADQKRALVVCSGGLDSTTAARWAQIQGYEITLLHFLYGCRAQHREIEAVRNIASHLKCDYRLEDLSWLGRLGGSSLTDESLPITIGETGAEFAHEWVPARNLVFSALAASLCDRFGYDTIVMGLNLEEGGAYPDNTVEFYEALNHVCDIGTMSRPEILSPLGNLVKYEIVRLALDIEAPIHLSWSCYYGREHHCGQCGPCYMRQIAFSMVGKHDPIVYETVVDP